MRDNAKCKMQRKNADYSSTAAAVPPFPRKGRQNNGEENEG